MLTRRALMASGAALVASCATPRPRGGARPAHDFVRRDGTAFQIGSSRYRYSGANIWYGAYLGADAPFGNRASRGVHAGIQPTSGVDA